MSDMMTDASAPPSSQAARQEAETSGWPLYLQRRFAPLWVAFCLGAFTDNMLRQSLIIGISFGYISLHGVGANDGAVPVIGALFAVAMFVFSPIAGQVADRVETLVMFRRTKFVEMLIMAAAAAGFLLDNGLWLIVALFAMASQSAFFSPARNGAMPKYFAADELIRANGLFNAGLFVSILLGLLFGGMLIRETGGREIIAAVLFLASLTGWLAARMTLPAAANAPNLKINWNIAAQGVRILSFAFKAPGVARPMIGVALFYLLSTHITVLTPFYARDALGAGSGIANAIMVFYVIGAGGGAVGAALLAKGRNGFGMSTFGVIAAAVLTFAVVLLTGPVANIGAETFKAFISAPLGIALAICLSLSAASMSLYIVPLQAAIQRRAPAENRARIMAATNMMIAAMAATGSLFVLLFTQTDLKATDALLIVAVLQMTIAAYMIQRHFTIAGKGYD
jgi:MFS family permease